MRGSRGYADEAHFLRAAALAMRHALINHAAERLADVVECRFFAGYGEEDTAAALKEAASSQCRG